MRVVFLQTLLLLLSITIAIAQVQTVEDITKQLIPPSPQAASLGKYGDVPVNYHTGGVTLSVPLYEVKIGSITLPISLSYQTSGIRVTDVSSRVGLGWTLQGEGVITRTVRGLPDEDTFGYGYTSSILSYIDFYSSLNNPKYAAAEAVANGYYDSEPDIYSYNFFGKSGKFYVDPTHGIVKIPHNNLKINPEWTIVDENGNKFLFTETEETTVLSSTNSPTHISSWYLTKVTTPKNEEMFFIYDENSDDIEYGFIVSETDYYSHNGGSKPPVRTVSSQRIRAKKLLRIETRVEKVEFIYDTEENDGDGRLDLKGDYRLKKIRIVSKITNQCVREFDFEQQYSSASETCVTPNYPTFANTESDQYRLKLNAVIERSCDGSQSKRHSFAYNPQLLPSRCSFAQDHWGYYNAKNNTTLKPRISFFPPSYVAGNRESNPLVVGAESLTEIHYPTGGYSKFEFEPHKKFGEVTYDTLLESTATITNALRHAFDNETFNLNNRQLVEIKINYNFLVNDGTGAAVQVLKSGSPVYSFSLDAVNLITDGGYVVTPPIQLDTGSYTLRVVNSSDVDGVSIHAELSYYNKVTGNRDTYFGGLRIKSISDYTDVGVLATKKSFTYEDPLILGSISEFNYYYFMGETEYSGCYEGGGGAGSVTRNYVVRTSSNNFVLGASQGSHVAYGKVTVTNNGLENGKSVYEYTIPHDLDEGAYFPFPQRTSLEHRRGLLTREAQYDVNNALVKEILNTYQFDSVLTIGAFKVGFEHNSLCYDWSNGGRVADTHAYGIYRMLSEWVKLTSTEERVYPGPISLKTDMFYDNIDHMQVTRKEKERTDGKYDLEYFIFPDDYGSGTAFIDSLTTRNIKTAVVEQVKAISDANGSNKKIVSAMINKYSSAKAGLLSEVHTLELDDPISLSSFKFSNRIAGNLPTQGSATSFSPYTEYTGNVFFDSYDAFGNVIQFHTNQGINVSLKWGYNSSRPVAMVKNAISSELFYEGFEEHVGAISTYPFAGKKYKSGSYTVSFTRPNAKSYTVTYWKLVGGDWQLVHSPLLSDNPVINPGVPIDEVFIYPALTEFKLLSFDPDNLRISNETNAGHTISYYSYDNLQRLQVIKDHNRDIVNEFLYHYRSND